MTAAAGLAMRSLPGRADFSAARHPILRLAFHGRESTQEIRRFVGLLREVADTQAPLDHRRQLALQVLEAIDDLPLEGESKLALEREWLSGASVNPGGALLLEAYALSEIRAGGYQLEPPIWIDAIQGSLILQIPRLIPMEDSPPKRHWLDEPVGAAYPAFASIVYLAIRDESQGLLVNWSEEECLAAIRALIVLAAVRNDGKRPPNSSMSPERFEGVGLGLWRSLHAQIKLISGLHAHVSHLHAQQTVLLHVQGLLHARILREETPPKKSRSLTGSRGFILIQGPIPPSTDKYDEHQLNTYEPLTTEALPTKRAPGAERLQALLNELKNEFPWCREAVELLAERLLTAIRQGVRDLSLPPMLLFGPPGAGKSRLSRRIAELLQLPYMPIGCGGASDVKVLSRTARGWASEEPSPLIRMLIQHRSASALVLLDEIEKAALSGSSSPPITSLLLGLLEPETARRWHDSYLHTTCDLSHVTYFATANGLTGLPSAVLSRSEMVYVPEPGAEHLDSLISGVTRDLEHDWGLQTGVLPRMPTSNLPGRRVDARTLKKLVLRFISSWSTEHLAPERLH